MALTEFESKSVAAAEKSAEAQEKAAGAAAKSADTYASAASADDAERQLHAQWRAADLEARIRQIEADERRAEALERQAAAVEEQVKITRQGLEAANAVPNGFSKAESVKLAILASLIESGAFMRPNTASTPNGWIEEGRKDADRMRYAFDAIVARFGDTLPL